MRIGLHTETMRVYREQLARTPGQVAYETDCALEPTYHDGTTRRPWSALSDPVRDTWERNPTTRALALRAARPHHFTPPEM